MGINFRGTGSIRENREHFIPSKYTRYTVVHAISCMQYTYIRNDRRYSAYTKKVCRFITVALTATLVGSSYLIVQMRS